jgi:alpha-glucosidase
VGDRTTRFRDPASAHVPLPPFPAYLQPLRERGPAPAATRTRALFATRDGWNIAHVPIEPGVSLYATGEQAGPLLRNGLTRTLWNTDAFDYTDRSPSIYQSHPWVLGVRRDGSAFGVVIETTARLVINLHAGLTAMRPFRKDTGPAPAVTIIERDSPMEVVRALADLTGRIALPPRWALGYHQCRWSYEPDEKVREIAKGFRDRGIPCDVLWLDIDYMDAFRCFTFDPVKFSKPRELFKDLHAQGFRVVCMIDPGLKVDRHYGPYMRAHQRGYFIKDAHGHEYHGEVWPGMCAFPDFTRRDVRAWWADLYKDFMGHTDDEAIDGVWNDMNEPAVFKGPQKSMPSDNHHDADEDLGGPGPHERYHNIYGMQMARATREGILAARPDKRPFVLTRANFLGGQRYAAMWTGDNRADWRHLRWSISMALNMGLSGQPFAGPDIGGFVGESTPELFARWMGIGALLPFARGHKIKEASPHEPWSLGETCQRTCTLALRRRSRLMPYLYSLFREASTTGAPVVRPAFFADATDPRLRAEDASFLLGDALLVRCDVLPPRDDGSLVGPASPFPLGVGAWTRLEPLALDVSVPRHDGAPADANLPELWLRRGHALPIGPIKEHDAQSVAGDSIVLAAALDERGHARATVYEDAGDGFGYERGEHRLTRWLISRDSSGKPVATIEHAEGAWPRASPPSVVVIE